MAGKILIVDDDEGLRESLSLLLSDEDYDVATASNGDESLRLVEGVQYDAILCDLRMPGRRSS